MIDVSEHFGKKEVCEVCQVVDSKNNQQHLLECIVLNSTPELVYNSTHDLPGNKFANYSDLYKEDPNKVLIVSKLLQKSFQRREILLEQK